jgi:hypothetical protein
MTSTLFAKVRRTSGMAVLAGVGLLGLVPQGRAEPVAHGNTRYRHAYNQDGRTVTIDGTLSVAVFKKQAATGDVWGTGIFGLEEAYFTPGVGSLEPTLDTDANYLYVYQLVNDGGSGQTVGSVGMTVKQATSWGAFATLGLFDDQGAIRSGNGAGTDGAPFNNLLNAGGSSEVGLETIEPPGVVIGRVELLNDGAGAGFDSFRAVWGVDGAVGPNNRSATWAFTSNSAPNLAIFSVQGGSSVNADTYGTVTKQGGGGGGDPTPTPEPSTFALACLGLTALGANAWRRLRTKKLDAAV